MAVGLKPRFSHGTIARRLCAACLHVMSTFPSLHVGPSLRLVFRRLLCEACVARWYVKSHKHRIKVLVEAGK